jgi:TolB-like protein
MKKVLIYIFTLFACTGLFAQQFTVAVSPFEARGGLSKDDADSVSELFVAELVANGTVRVVDRNNFDKIMAEMKFQSSDWADSKRIAELGRATGANSIIRGTVVSLGGEIVITATALDINTAQILSSSTLRMRRINEVFEKLPSFVGDMVAKLPRANTPAPVPASTGIGIEVSTRVAGTLYFQDEEIAELWGNDTHTIPIERPGTYTVKLALPNKIKLVRTVNITIRGVTKVNFSNATVNIGDEGPGGGIIFYIEGGSKYFECSEDIGQSNWDQALIIARNYRGGGYTDWRLPNKDELNLMYINLKQKGLGGFSGYWYWSSSQIDTIYSWLQSFRDGRQYNNSPKDNSFSVRAVRAF